MTIEMFDLFGAQLFFSTLGKFSFQTLAGGILTLVSITAIIVSAAMFGKEIIMMKNPKYFSEELIADNSGEITINNTNLNMIFRLEDDYGKPLSHESVLGLYYSYQEYYLNNITRSYVPGPGITNALMEKCDSNKIKDTSLSDGLNLTEWYCPQYLETDNKIGGYWSSPIVKYFSIILNTDPSPSLRSPMEKVKKLFESRRFLTYFLPAASFNPSDYTNGLRTHYQKKIVYLSSNMSYYEEIKFKHYQIKDDVGWIFEQFKEKSIIGFDQLNSNVDLLNSDRTLYYLNIFFKQDVILCHRTYMKIQELAASIGGLKEVIMLLCKFAMSPYSTFLLNRTLISLVVNPDTNMSAEKRVALTGKKITGIKQGLLDVPANINLSPNLIEYNIKLKTPKLSSFYQIKEQIKKVKGPYSKLSFFDFATYRLLCRQPLSYKIYRESMLLIRSLLDNATYLNLLHHYQSFESIFLNKHQRKALEFTRKIELDSLNDSPILSLTTYNDQSRLTKSAKSVANYFVTKYHNEKASGTDEVIIEMLEHSLKDFVKKVIKKPQ